MPRLQGKPIDIIFDGFKPCSGNITLSLSEFGLNSINRIYNNDDGGA
jgi:hypothetical protein